MFNPWAVAMKEQEKPDGLIFNAFQTPNLLVDRMMPLLTDNELRISLFAIRHIYGWVDTRPDGASTLSVTSFERGHRGSAGCGLARATIVDALNTLERYGVMRRVGKAGNKGQRWSFAVSEHDIDWDALELRKAAACSANRERTEKARAARKAKRDAAAGLSDRPAHRYVGQTSTGMSDRPAPVCRTDRALVCATDHIETQSFETQEKAAAAALAEDVERNDTPALEHPTVFALYERNIGPLTPLIGDKLKDLEQEYSAGWIADAIAEAVECNGRSIRYIEKILIRWQSEGKTPLKERKKHDRSSRSPLDGRRVSRATRDADPDRWLPAQFRAQRAQAARDHAAREDVLGGDPGEHGAGAAGDSAD